MPLTISVCIPCIQEHIYLLGRCVESIYTQTLQPEEVVISISNITEEIIGFPRTKAWVESLVEMYRTELNIIIYYTSEKKYAGENRNTAIGISTGEIVSFIDADDIMYTNRINIINTIFSVCPKALCVLHHFTENALGELIPDQTYNDDKIVDYNFSELIHYGHPSLRREIFKQFLYSKSPRTQDMDFIQTVVEKYRDRILVYERPLTCYVSNDSTYFTKDL